MARAAKEHIHHSITIGEHLKHRHQLNGHSSGPIPCTAGRHRAHKHATEAGQPALSVFVERLLRANRRSRARSWPSGCCARARGGVFLGRRDAFGSGGLLGPRVSLNGTSPSRAAVRGAGRFGWCFVRYHAAFINVASPFRAQVYKCPLIQVHTALL